MSDFITASVSLPAEENDLFSNEKKKCYWAFTFCFCVLEKRISTLIVCLLVMTFLNNKNISSSFCFPTLQYLTLLQLLKVHMFKRTQLSIFYQLQWGHIICRFTLRAVYLTFGLQSLSMLPFGYICEGLCSQYFSSEKSYLSECIYICRNFLHSSSHF